MGRIFLQIRIALKDWDDLIRFQQDAVNAQHYDVVYIVRKLLYEKAFCFTAMPDKVSVILYSGA